jgi:hypothetical protein
MAKAAKAQKAMAAEEAVSGVKMYGSEETLKMKYIIGEESSAHVWRRRLKGLKWRKKAFALVRESNTSCENVANQSSMACQRNNRNNGVMASAWRWRRHGWRRGESSISMAANRLKKLIYNG